MSVDNQNNGKSLEQIKREEFEANPDQFVHIKQILLGKVYNPKTKLFDIYFDKGNEHALKSAAFDLNRITINVINVTEMQRAQQQKDQIVVPGKKSMSEIQRRFK